MGLVFVIGMFNQFLRSGGNEVRRERERVVN